MPRGGPAAGVIETAASVGLILLRREPRNPAFLVLAGAADRIADDGAISTAPSPAVVPRGRPHPIRAGAMLLDPKASRVLSGDAGRGKGLTHTHT